MASITSATSLSGIPPITSSIIINLILVSFISVTSVNQSSLRILIRFFVSSYEWAMNDYYEQWYTVTMKFG